MHASKLGAPYRSPSGGRQQDYIVTFDDGTQELVTVPTAYGRMAAQVAKDRAKARRLS